MQRYPEQHSPTPRKPPRGKLTRETVNKGEISEKKKYFSYLSQFQHTSSSNLLMSVIKTLDASENNEQRDREKLKIEKEFKKSDKRLQELVGKNDSDLTNVGTGSC